jgi:phosphatidylethanolamine/phosphatidyl-N-methylethanolamine N-methyltransferase
MEERMDSHSVVSAYRRYAGVYDFVFGPVLEPGRKRMVESMACKPGECVLEIGVGTGLSLRHYPASTQIIGIDLSRDMLARAASRVMRSGWDHVSLMHMDAQRLAFADNSFDKVAVMYVASVVPDPDAMMREIRRVCRPGGDIFVVNHFSQPGHGMHWLENLASPFSKLIGFRPLFPMPDFVTLTGLPLLNIMPVNAFGYWTLLHLRNLPEGGVINSQARFS